MRQHSYADWIKHLGFIPKPCIRCGSDDLSLWDLGDDAGYEIACRNCGVVHYGAFALDAGKSWNIANDINELRTWMGESQKEWVGVRKK